MYGNIVNRWLTGGNAYQEGGGEGCKKGGRGGGQYI